jgi:hypothetical protein
VNALQFLSALPDHPALWRGSDLARTRYAGLATGFPQLDAELPGGGWPVGALTELLPAHEGIGELRVLGPALAALSKRKLWLAWIAPPYSPYAPALAAAGIDPGQMIIVRTHSDQDTLWAAEQALASNACGAVLAWLPVVRYPQLRRLHLAAEHGRALALLFRPPQAAREPSPAALRIALAATDGRLAAHIFKRRGAPLDRIVLLPAMPLVERRKVFNHDVDSNPFPATAARDPAARITVA